MAESSDLIVAKAARRKIEWELLSVLFVGCLCFAAYLGHELWCRSKVNLPDEVRTIQQFADSMPPPKEVWYLEGGSNNAFVVIGDMPCGVPSGPPVYVFNQRGDLVDWTPDLGDTPENKRYKFYSPGGKRVPLGVALKLAQEVNK